MKDEYYVNLMVFICLKIASISGPCFEFRLTGYLVYSMLYSRYVNTIAPIWHAHCAQHLIATFPGSGILIMDIVDRATCSCT